MGHLPRKVVGGASPREATWAATGKATGVELSVSVGTQIIPPQALHATQG